MLSNRGFLLWGSPRSRRETICHATSRDLVHWRENRANPVARPDPDMYSLGHWRDPFVLWNQDAGEFQMMVTAEPHDGPAGRTGCRRN